MPENNKEIEKNKLLWDMGVQFNCIPFLNMKKATSKEVAFFYSSSSLSTNGKWIRKIDP